VQQVQQQGQQGALLRADIVDRALSGNDKQCNRQNTAATHGGRSVLAFLAAQPEQWHSQSRLLLGLTWGVLQQRCSRQHQHRIPASSSLRQQQQQHQTIPTAALLNPTVLFACLAAVAVCFCSCSAQKQQVSMQVTAGLTAAAATQMLMPLAAAAEVTPSLK
jgi:hypothetical protein